MVVAIEVCTVDCPGCSLLILPGKTNLKPVAMAMLRRRHVLKTAQSTTQVRPHRHGFPVVMWRVCWIKGAALSLKME